eukprot:TRINITY_DN17025_c0_g1_i3.p1 TRINITY_DN17025_c0_g1~~TRINITY_DN17025_c0_g1_i3.p1  ORF type:complete len:659 (-),score=65.49 TRINITY_DN17025_c0_g1_i3:64-2040(-)
MVVSNSNFSIIVGLLLCLFHNAFAAFNVFTCMTFSVSGEYYLTGPILYVSIGACFNITSPGVVLDGQGYTITREEIVDSANGAIIITGSNCIVKNLNIFGVNLGITVLSTRNTTISNCNITLDAAQLTTHQMGIYSLNAYDQTYTYNRITGRRPSLFVYGMFIQNLDEYAIPWKGRVQGNVIEGLSAAQPNTTSLTIGDGSVYGILLSRVLDSVVRDNIIANLTGGDGISITNNNASMMAIKAGSAIGILLDWRSSSNMILNNTIRALVGGTAATGDGGANYAGNAFGLSLNDVYSTNIFASPVPSNPTYAGVNVRRAMDDGADGAYNISSDYQLNSFDGQPIYFFNRMNSIHLPLLRAIFPTPTTMSRGDDKRGGYGPILITNFPPGGQIVAGAIFLSCENVTIGNVAINNLFAPSPDYKWSLLPAGHAAGLLFVDIKKVQLKNFVNITNVYGGGGMLASGWSPSSGGDAYGVYMRDVKLFELGPSYVQMSLSAGNASGYVSRHQSHGDGGNAGRCIGFMCTEVKDVYLRASGQLYLYPGNTGIFNYSISSNSSYSQGQASRLHTLFLEESTLTIIGKKPAQRFIDELNRDLQSYYHYDQYSSIKIADLKYQLSIDVVYQEGFTFEMSYLESGDTVFYAQHGHCQGRRRNDTSPSYS